MIASSVKTNHFNEVTPDPRFRVDTPPVNSLVASAPLDITASKLGTQVELAEQRVGMELTSVEAMLDELVARSRRDVELHPDSARAHTNLAIALMKHAQLDQAEEVLNRALELNPEDYVALNNLALLRISQERLDDAVRVYEQIRSSNLQNAVPLISLAHVEIRRQNFIRAADLLAEAIKIDDKSILAKYQLAMVLLRLEKVHQSITLLRQATQQHVRVPELHQALGVAYLLARDLRRSERSFGAALALNPSMSSAVHGLANLYFAKGEFEKAVTVLQDFLNGTPNDLQARELLARGLVQVAQPHRARTQLQQVMTALKSDDPSSRIEIARISNNIGFTYALEGSYSDAKAWLEKSIEINPSCSPAPYSNLAQIYFSQGQPRVALQVLEKQARYFPTDVYGALFREVAWMLIGDFEQAANELQALLNRADPPSQAYADLGWILCDWRRDKDAAIAVLEKGAARYPNDVFILNNLAYAYLMRGQTQLALAVLERVPEGNDQIVQLVATRGLLRLHEGDFQGAEALYREAEVIASRAGMLEIARAVRQKKHLEMARAYLRLGNAEQATRHAELGTRVVNASPLFPFASDLNEFVRHLPGAKSGNLHQLEGQ